MKKKRRGRERESESGEGKEGGGLVMMVSERRENSCRRIRRCTGD